MLTPNPYSVQPGQCPVHEARPDLNYDPADPDKMNLPAGKTCGDCIHIRRCTLMFGHMATDTSCDWSPSRFRLAASSPPTIVQQALSGKPAQEGE